MKVEESVEGVLDMIIRDTTFTGNVAGTEVRLYRWSGFPRNGAFNSFSLVDFPFPFHVCQGDDIYQDYAERALIDCGENSGNNFCDASSSSTSISTNWPASTCAGASTETCPIVDSVWNVVNLS